MKSNSKLFVWRTSRQTLHGIHVAQRDAMSVCGHHQLTVGRRNVVCRQSLQMGSVLSHEFIVAGKTAGSDDNGTAGMNDLLLACNFDDNAGSTAFFEIQVRHIC